MINLVTAKMLFSLLPWHVSPRLKNPLFILYRLLRLIDFTKFEVKQFTFS